MTTTPPPRRRGPALHPKSHCVHGHSLHDAYVFPNGRRKCRRCQQAASLAWYYRHKAQKEERVQ